MPPRKNIIEPISARYFSEIKQKYGVNFSFENYGRGIRVGVWGMKSKPFQYAKTIFKSEYDAFKFLFKHYLGVEYQ